MNIDVEHVAKLARLSVDIKDIPQMEKEMQKIIDMIGTLPDDLTGDFSLEEKEAMLLRLDTPEKSLSRDVILANAPQTQAGCFVVPKIV